MSQQNKVSDLFNSKTEDVIIELPEYAYCHSSEAENRVKPFFIGRIKLIKRLKHIIISTTTKTGVYLVAGDRGVGKTSLVDEVIRKTSLQNKSIKEKNMQKLLKNRANAQKRRSYNEN